MRPIIALVLAGIALPLALSPAAAQNAALKGRVAFVTCPIVRDTEPVPCWMARYNGELYYIGIQGDISENFHPPQQRHQALIEGVVSDEPRICGGIVLKQAVASTLPELDLKCQETIKGEGHRVDFAPRGPGPANRGMQAATDPNPGPGRAAAPPPAPPFTPKTFDVHFTFDGEYINAREYRFLAEAATYAKATGGAVEVRGVDAKTRLTDGKVMTEMPGLARQRADKIAQALRDLGIADSKIAVAIAQAPSDIDPSMRKVAISVTP